MSKQDRLQTPSSQTGLIRFYDVSSSTIQLDPKVVLIFAGAVIVLEIVLQAFA
ncbi:preprotein translocase subunit Sec61beta [Candidatus Micrarchaeota archaeon]|nr:preprotein translocase subunit Sec61beta [Candidatus Micrarchaeota archaeon]